MKKYQITKDEFNYLQEIISYLDDEGTTLSPNAHAEIATVVDKIKSRPILDIMIDPNILDKAQDLEAITND